MFISGGREVGTTIQVNTSNSDLSIRMSIRIPIMYGSY